MLEQRRAPAISAGPPPDRGRRVARAAAPISSRRSSSVSACGRRSPLRAHDVPHAAGNFVFVRSAEPLGERLEEQGLVVRVFAEGIRDHAAPASRERCAPPALGAEPGPRAGPLGVRLRMTTETALRLSLALDGTGRGRVATGIGFLDHLLTLLAFHAGFDLELLAGGDLDVDDHHLVEDTLAALGTALSQALGNATGSTGTAPPSCRWTRPAPPPPSTSFVVHMPRSRSASAGSCRRARDVAPPPRTRALRDGGRVHRARGVGRQRTTTTSPRRHSRHSARRCATRWRRVAAGCARPRASRSPQARRAWVRSPTTAPATCARSAPLLTRDADPVLTTEPDAVREAPLAVIAGVGHVESAARGLAPTGSTMRFATVSPPDGPPRHLRRHAAPLRGERGRWWRSRPARGPVQRVRARRVPHMGWNTLDAADWSALLAGLDGADVYFAHSYAAEFPTTTASSQRSPRRPDRRGDRVGGRSPASSSTRSEAARRERACSRTHSHGQETRDPVSRRGVGPRRQGRPLRRPAGRRRPGRACAPLLRARRRRARLPRHHRHRRGTRADPARGRALGRAAHDPLHRGRRHLGSRTHGRSCAAAPTRSRSTGLRSTTRRS